MLEPKRNSPRQTGSIQQQQFVLASVQFQPQDYDDKVICAKKPEDARLACAAFNLYRQSGSAG
jgi:hypothetical protein